MESINRWILILKPQRSLLNWLKSIPGHDPGLTLSELRECPTTILIPEFDADEDADEFVRKNSETFFEGELLGIGVNKAYWPTSLSFELFKEWFEIEISSVVFDYVKKDIVKE